MLRRLTISAGRETRSSVKPWIFISPQLFRRSCWKLSRESLANLEKLLADVHWESILTLEACASIQSVLLWREQELAEAGLAKRDLQGEVYQARLDQNWCHSSDGLWWLFPIVWGFTALWPQSRLLHGDGTLPAVGSLVAYVWNYRHYRKEPAVWTFPKSERYTMPDIDIDIPDVYRPEFIRYVRDIAMVACMRAQIVTYQP